MKPEINNITQHLVNKKLQVANNARQEDKVLDVFSSVVSDQTETDKLWVYQSR